MDFDGYGIDELTPVEEHRGILYKRDDLYVPFHDVPLSGGKVRQSLCLLRDNYEYIRDECEGTVITATSVKSPQGIIVSRAAKEFGFRSILVVGATKEKTLSQNVMMNRALSFGCEIDSEAKMGYENVLMSRIDSICKYHNYFVIKFGINLYNNTRAIVDSISNQVQNIPDDLDLLVVNIGSGITFGGILRGLTKYNKHPKKVIGIQIAGYDRRNTINQIAGDYYCDYEYIQDKTYPYSRMLKVMFSDKEYLDPIYESKAYNYMMKNLDTENNKTLFWIVGNSMFVR